MQLIFFSFTTVHAKWPKLVPNLYKILDSTLQLNTNSFLTLQILFDLVLISHLTVLFKKTFANIADP